MSVFHPADDYSLYDNASALANRIAAYWQARGYSVQPELKRYSTTPDGTPYFRIVLPPFPNGFPPDPAKAGMLAPAVSRGRHD